MGENVRVSQVAVAQGNLTVQVTETPRSPSPTRFGQGDTAVVPRTRIEIEEGGGQMVVLDGGVSLQSLVAGLNALGVGPRDLIGILQAIKAAGALQARDRGDVMSELFNLAPVGPSGVGDVRGGAGTGPGALGDRTGLRGGVPHPDAEQPDQGVSTPAGRSAAVKATRSDPC